MTTHDVFLLLVYGFHLTPECILNVFTELDEANAAVSDIRRATPRCVLLVDSSHTLGVLLQNEAAIRNGVNALFTASSSPVRVSSRNLTEPGLPRPLPCPATPFGLVAINREQLAALAAAPAAQPDWQHDTEARAQTQGDPDITRAASPTPPARQLGGHVRFTSPKRNRSDSSVRALTHELQRANVVPPITDTTLRTTLQNLATYAFSSAHGMREILEWAGQLHHHTRQGQASTRATGSFADETDFHQVDDDIDEQTIGLGSESL